MQVNEFDQKMSSEIGGEKEMTVLRQEEKPSEGTMEPVLEIKDLVKAFQRKGKEPFYAVNHVSLVLNSGQTIGIVGESGSGKTTLGRCIMRLFDDAKGEVIYGGRNILQVRGEELKEYRRDVQMIFQDPYSSLNPRKRAGDIIGAGMKNLLGERNRQQRREKVLSIMERCGLSDYHYMRYPHEFSGGQRQRIGIARALAVNPKVIIADEPTSALDVSIQAQIINLLMDLKEEFHLSMLFISHDLSVVRYISDWVAVMYRGEIVEFAPTKELFEQPKHEYTRRLLAAIPRDNPIQRSSP